METRAHIGYGIQLSRGNGASPEVFTPIAEVVDLSPPSMSRTSVEATHNDSPGGYKEFIPGLRDGGEFSATCNFLPKDATQNNTSGGVLNDFGNDTVARNYRITFPGDSPLTTWTFKAFVTGYEPTAPIDGKMTLVVKFKVTGAPTVA